ncbi:hypothetical protein pb186bvf_012693 [Paramecium bursaria]
MLLDQLPQQFKQFLDQQGIDPKIFEFEQTLRYVRLKPDTNLTFEELQNKISQNLKPIEYAQNIYSLPETEKISQLEIYKQGLLYGIDLSSALVVLAMQISEQDHKILEICCAPGAKLMFMADLLKQFNNQDQIQRKAYGVDISQNRLQITQQLINKYNLNDQIQVFQDDGTTFKQDFLFDKVLVDAECTHEGSIKHLKKYISNNLQNKKQKKANKSSQKQLKKNHTNHYISEFTKPNNWDEQDFIERFLDQNKLNSITNLQYKLLENGFNNLRNGGMLVYSTCSFSKQQNEDIIEKFIKQYPVELVNVFDNDIPCKKGSLEKTIRFDPSTNNSGGMFIAKMIKKLK